MSDKGIAVLAFATYHQLESAQPVTKVVRDDGNGHKADNEPVRELESLNLARPEGNNIVFTDTGVTVLARAVKGLRSASCAA